MSLYNTFSSASIREVGYETKSLVCPQAFYHIFDSP